MSQGAQIHIAEYQYELPQEAIARYPLEERDQSRLLVCRSGEISHRSFRDLPSLLPGDAWLVFNNTKVVQARLPFRKSTGARIEIFCLEPHEPADYQQNFESRSTCTWWCLVGNAKKWKSGSVFLEVTAGARKVTLQATLLEKQASENLVRFDWDKDISFAELMELGGSTPIPPYLNREAEESDKDRYQTVYRKDPGSVAAPTAGLHFTADMLKELEYRGCGLEHITLHVGAGTFVPVKYEDARMHSMHAETVLITRAFLEHWLESDSHPLAVGTTSTRSLESLYWLGVKLKEGQELDPGFEVFRQWDNESLPQDVCLRDSLEALHAFYLRHGLDEWHFSTSLMIVPGYHFRSIRGLITNFHMPGSTLLLLIAALIGDDWKKVYDEALLEGYRFLSYGDSSLLIP
jgi:S-adenosylmethionine:tRNA ribosyltransferase-isomerase